MWVAVKSVLQKESLAHAMLIGNIRARIPWVAWSGAKKRPCLALWIAQAKWSAMLFITIQRVRPQDFLKPLAH
jgi:hypothetical protein